MERLLNRPGGSGAETTGTAPEPVSTHVECHVRSEPVGECGLADAAGGDAFHGADGVGGVERELGSALGRDDLPAPFFFKP